MLFDLIKRLGWLAAATIVLCVLIVALGAGWYVKSNRKSRHAA